MLTFVGTFQPQEYLFLGAHHYFELPHRKWHSTVCYFGLVGFFALRFVRLGFVHRPAQVFPLPTTWFWKKEKLHAAAPVQRF